MCIRCKDCGWIGELDDMMIVHDDPSADGVSLPAGHYSYSYCPECGSDDCDDFDIADMIEVESAEEYDAEISAFKDRISVGFDRNGLIKSLFTSKGKWIFVG